MGILNAMSTAVNQYCEEQKDIMVEELKSISNLKTELDTLTKRLLESNKGTRTLKNVHRNSELCVPRSSAIIEVLGGRSGCFKPLNIQMTGLTEKGKKAQFEILDIRVMGSPQIINYTGSTVSAERGISDFYKDGQNIDWGSFGSCAGQGLQITVLNVSPESATLYIKLEGYELPGELLGKI